MALQSCIALGSNLVHIFVARVLTLTTNCCWWGNGLGGSGWGRGYEGGG